MAPLQPGRAAGQTPLHGLYHIRARLQPRRKAGQKTAALAAAAAAEIRCSKRKQRLKPLLDQPDWLAAEALRTLGETNPALLVLPASCSTIEPCRMA